MTVGPDGVFLTWGAGHTVAHRITTTRDGGICGLITCQACQRSWLHYELDDPDIDPGFAHQLADYITQSAALVHAKTCTGAADQPPSTTSRPGPPTT